ncbi:MAG: FAD:protein FMN transferase [Acidobacteria bacterium]|nr:FAD:protein FMN transferase [Acidobacteriota bacterium]
MTARAEQRFRAMGTDCHVVVRTAPASDDDRAGQLVEWGIERVRALEARWSRFLSDSDTSRLNDADGAEVGIDETTAELLRVADAARSDTLGWFDPYQGRAMVELGYDRPFEEVRERIEAVPAGTATVDRPAIGEPLRTRSPLRLDPARRRAALDAGVSFDPGGIGKGQAADVVSAELLALGAEAALVNLGGDLRVRGGEEAPWRIDVRNPFDETLEPVLQVGLSDAGLATSSPFKRRWRTTDGRAAHHIIDPRNGAPATVALAAVTVVAPAAATAEMLTTAVALAGPVHGAALLSRHRARAWVVTLDGRIAPV